jgi:hypothetical protein
MNNNWQLIHHSDVETPYFEITNGPISLCVNEDDMPFEAEIDNTLEINHIVDTLNTSKVKFRSENKLELDQHIEIMELKSDVHRCKELLQTVVSRHEAGLLPDIFIYEKIKNLLNGK